MPESKVVLAPFLRLPSKKAFPDYFQVIEHPISLAEIKTRNNKSDYTTLQSLFDDFKLLRDNALQYNEQTSEIAVSANLILRTVEDYLIQSLTAQDGDITPVKDYMSQLEQHELRIMDELAKFKQGRRFVAELFIDEPSREEYPEYYNIISNATSINTIKSQISSGKARTITAFKEIVQPMFDNAHTANEENSQVVADAKLLEKSFQSRLDKMIKQLSTEPTGYTAIAASIVEGQCPAEDSPADVDQDKDTAKSATPLKLRIKAPAAQTPKDSPRLKINLKTSAKSSRTAKAAVATNEADAEEEPKVEESAKETEKEAVDEPTAEATDAKSEEAKEEVAEDTKQEPEATNPPAEEITAEPIEEVFEPRNILRDAHQSPSEALLKSVIVSSVIPITSKYHLQKSPPPPAVLNLFQITVPSSQKYTVQSYSLSLPPFHRTINLNTTINENLNHQYYDLVLSHNYRQVKAYSSSTSSPWADANTPITHKFELNLVTGLNFVEITVSSQKGKAVRHAAASSLVDREDEKKEKISFWITRMRG